MDFAGGAGSDRLGDHLRVQGLEDGFVVVRGDNAAHGVRGDIREVLKLEGFFLCRGGREG